MEDKILKAIESLRSDINEKLEILQTQVKENTDILKALEHSSQVNKAEHDSMMNDIAHIKGDVQALRKDLSNVEIITASNWTDIAKLKAVK